MSESVNAGGGAIGGNSTAPAPVRHYCPGGRETGGGIGRLVGYVVDEAGRGGARHYVCDTRGPRWAVPRSLGRLAAALSVMAWDRIAAPDRIHHIHVAGRGSTSRKLILSAAARTLGCRHILHLHDYDYAADLDLRSPRKQGQIRQMFRGADRVIVLGQRDRETVTGRLGVSADRVVVLHNGVPDPGGAPGARGSESAPLILFLGQLSERKGVPELMAALAGEAMAGCSFRAVLAGDGPVAAFRAEADALGLSDRVTLPGWVGEAEVRALCREADVLVLPSHAEGLAMAVIEGMANGLAVVTTRVGAHEEALTHDVNCLFVPVGDAGALGATLRRLCDDPALRARLGAAARAQFLSRYRIDAYLRQLEPVYRGVEPRAADLVGAE